MELEQWFKQHNIKEMVINDLKYYLAKYEEIYDLNGEIEDDYLRIV